MRRLESGRFLSVLMTVDAVGGGDLSYTQCACHKFALMLRKFLLIDSYVFHEVEEEVLSVLR